MYGRSITFSFELDKKAMIHLKDISSYNHNYYELDLNAYGDYIIAEKCNILYEECSDNDFEAYYILVYFEGDKFQAMFTWLNGCKHLNFIMED